MPVSDREAAVSAVRRASNALRTVADYLALEEPPRPPTEPVGPSELFGIDISEHQGDINLKRAEQEGAAFCFVRITGGLGPKKTRGVWVDKNAAVNLKKVADTNMVPGVYGYPVLPGGGRPNIGTQVDVFIQNAGGIEGFKGKLIGVDYERYGPDEDLTPEPEHVREYCRELQRRLGGPRYIELYAAREFWYEPPFSGDPRNYGAPGSIKLWQPWWPGDGAFPTFAGHYQNHRANPDYEWFTPVEGVVPNIAQVYIGLVDGRECDVNVFRGTREQLLRLTGEVPAGGDADPDEPNAEGLPRWITRPRDYLMQCPGGPYVPWFGGRFSATAPAYVGLPGTPAPAPETVRRLGGFCAAAHNLAQWANGIHPGDDRDSRPAWYGGVLWLGEIYQRERQVARRPLDDPADYPIMSLFVKNYECGPFDATCPLPAQGHTFVKLGPGRAFNFDRQFGGNIKRDVPASIALSGGLDFWVDPNDWLRPAGAVKI